MKYILRYQEIKIPNELKIILCQDIGMKDSFSVHELNSHLNKKGLILNFFEDVAENILSLYEEDKFFRDLFDHCENRFGNHKIHYQTYADTI